MTHKIGMLFDLDGVLIDSESEYTRIWTEIDTRFPSGIENMAHKIKGTTLDNILNTYYPDRREEVTELLYLREQEMEYRWLPGARQFLEQLIASDIPRAMVTSSNEEKLSKMRLQIPELEGMMSERITANRITRSKPDPEGYLLAASLLGVNPHRCAVFEDSLQGLKAGRAAGAYVIGVSGTLGREAVAPHCDLLVDSLADVDLPSLIATLSSR